MEKKEKTGKNRITKDKIETAKKEQKKEGIENKN